MHHTVLLAAHPREVPSIMDPFFYENKVKHRITILDDDVVSSIVGAQVINSALQCFSLKVLIRRCFDITGVVGIVDARELIRIYQPDSMASEAIRDKFDGLTEYERGLLIGALNSVLEETTESFLTPNIGNYIIVDCYSQPVALVEVATAENHDFYTIGGRWKDRFILKEGCTPPKEFEEYKTVIDGKAYYSSLPKGMIDFEAIGKKAAEEFKPLRDVLTSPDTINRQVLTMKECLAMERDMQTGGIASEDNTWRVWSRVLSNYYGQPLFKQLREKLSKVESDLHFDSIYMSGGPMLVDTYAENSGKISASRIIDGQLVNRHTYTASSENPVDVMMEWITKSVAWVDSLPDDQVLTIVDYHN